MFKINILTAYPEMFPGSLGYSILGKALNEKKWSLNIINLHDFGFDERKSIDDEPFGGGPGMVIRPDVVEKALISIDNKDSKKRYLCCAVQSGAEAGEPNNNQRGLYSWQFRNLSHRHPCRKRNK